MEKVIWFSLYGEGKKRTPRVSGRQWDCSSSKPPDPASSGGTQGRGQGSAVGRAVPATGLSVGSGDPKNSIGVPAGGRWGALPWLRFCFVCDSDGRGLHASLVRAFPGESGRCTHHGYLTGTHVLEVPPPARGHKTEAWLGGHHWLLCCHQTPVAPFRRSPSSPPSIQGVLGGPGLIL